jgi:hypothetical protein
MGPGLFFDEANKPDTFSDTFSTGKLTYINYRGVVPAASQDRMLPATGWLLRQP